MPDAPQKKASHYQASDRDFAMAPCRAHIAKPHIPKTDPTRGGLNEPSADLPPKLELLHPTADVELPANGSLPVAYQASDPDFLLKSVVMKFEKEGELLSKQELLLMRRRTSRRRAGSR